MRNLLLRATVGVCLFTGLLPSAPKGNAGPIYERIICVVPLVGAGTLDDPKRPLFAPVAGASQQAILPGKKSKGFLDPAAIVSYQSVLTDDGTQAIVEFVARDRAALQPILGNRLGVPVFDLRDASLEAMLTALRQVKKNFSLSMLQGGTL